MGHRDRGTVFSYFSYRGLTHSFIYAIVCPISDEEKEYAGISSLSESGQCKRAEKPC